MFWWASFNLITWESIILGWKIECLSLGKRTEYKIVVHVPFIVILICYLKHKLILSVLTLDILFLKGFLIDKMKSVPTRLLKQFDQLSLLQYNLITEKKTHLISDTNLVTFPKVKANLQVDAI